MQSSRLESPDDYLRTYPHICSAIIAFSLGYATPTCAARILKDAHEREENWCEWVYSCYNKNPLPAVRMAIKTRHNLKGYMADYRVARRIVDETLKDRKNEPKFASWF